MDPLKPFGDLVRSISGTAGSKRTGSTQGQDAAGSERPRSGAAASTLEEQVGTRLRSIDPDDARRARTVFIETVLEREFGTNFAIDPAFGDLVQRIDEQLSRPGPLATQLTTLLRSLSSRSTIAGK